ncbi:NAD(P)H-dependent flavin oxidoreductase [Nocardia cerradoensis]|uniref:NAD(P)H-dependent flavin oxidoreductase n=1 Tax=Nocardia cerradoensis TaxID=85688 RepID=UPI001FE023C3|nr:nitronate monooxygenase [Nocardia cerradoensis]
MCRELGIEYPIFAFSHCRDVVAAVSRAGGMGVLGILAMSPDEIDVELRWLEEHSGGKPYGVDIVAPVSTADREAGLNDVGQVHSQLEDMIPAEHRQYAEEILQRYNVPQLPDTDGQQHGWATEGLTAAGGHDQIEVVLSHRNSLIVSALGPPPAWLVERAHESGTKIGALVGKPHQAVRNVDLGVDVIIAQSYEAAAHTGEIGSMVLTPDVVDAVGDVPVLAAGGIGSGRQMAAAMALGAQGVWTGSIWLACREAPAEQWQLDRLIEMNSTDTVRSKSQTGKFNRQIRTPWTEAWDDPKGPGALPMPLQYMLFADATARARRAGVHELVGGPVGQVVSRMTKVRPAAEIVLEMVEEYMDTLQRMSSQFEEITGD